LHLRFKANIAAPSTNEVMEFIARQMQNKHPRARRGLNRVLAHAALMRVPVTLDLARSLSRPGAKQKS